MISSPKSTPMPSMRPAKGQNPIEDIYPLTPLQQGMLFQHLYAPESVAYCMQICWTIQGQLQVAAFRSAWQSVINHHSVLRTRFAWERRDQPLQVVLRRVELPWDYQDWRGNAPTEIQARLQSYRAADSARGFQLDQAPLMRVALIRTGESTYELIWSHHHIVQDGWGTGLLMQDFLAYYEAACAGRTASLPPSRPYRDYVVWIAEQDQARAEAFWRAYLGGFHTPTALAIDRAPGSLPAINPSYADAHLRLDGETSAALRALACQHQVTLNTVVQGAWALLLSRYSGSRDVVFGITTAGRPAELPGAETMVGLCINTLPLRASIPPSATLGSWLRELQRQQLEARQFEHSALAELQGWSEVPRGTSLFESILVFQNYPIGAMDHVQQRLAISAGASVERTNYPLTLVAQPGQVLGFRLAYDTDRFAPQAIERLLGHLQTLLTAMASQRDGSVATLPLLTEAERHELLLVRNATPASYPAACYHQLVAEQAARSPGAIAVEYQGQTLSYQELDQRTNQLAHHLRAAGVGLGSCVGLCMERSLDLLVALLGIFKAGAAFLPLDPSFPPERMAFMLADSQARLLLTQATLQPRLAQLDLPVVALDNARAAIAAQPTSACESGVTPAHLAYIIYTSGSTGRPKGVMVQHGGLVNYLHWAIEAYTARKGSGAPVQSSIAADAIFPSLFTPLLAGNRVLLLPGSEAVEGLLALSEALQQHGPFGLVKITPTQLEVVNQQLPDDGPSDWVHTLVIGAEALRGETVRFWQRRAPQTTLLNEYGPTETIVGCSIYQLPAQSPISGAVPIGLPIANTQFYVLDPAMQPVPVGVPGELYIGGDCVAYGYQGRPDLTAKAFVPDPFSQQPGMRLYKTGDLVKYLPDRAANIEFLGRIDDQVKIRGYRVELGEVETTLTAHPAVRETVVLASGTAGERRLVAYVVPHDGQFAAAAEAELRAFLKARLPEYMVPEAFVLLAALPLTPHGKLNRQALPKPERATTAQAGLVAARTPLEATLAEIWASVLKIEQIGIHDSFFDLGGDSLLSLRVVARAKQAGIPLQPRLMFQHRTIAELAAALPSTPTASAAPERTLAEQGPVSGPAPLVPPQHWLLERSGLPQHQYYNPSIYEVAAEFDPERFRLALRHVMHHHDMLRARFLHEAQGWRQYIDPPRDEVPFCCYDFSGLAEDAQRRQIEAIGQRMHGNPDLAHGVLRMAYIKLGAHKPGRLLMMIHHLVTDGVSMAIFFEDLLTAYQQLSAQQAVRLPAKTSSFQRWAEQLHSYAQSPAAAQEFAYWRSLPWDRLVRLPRDFPENQQFATVTTLRRVSWELEAAATSRLLSAAQSSNTPIQELLLAAFAYAISQWAQTDTLLLMVIAHGRYPVFDDLDISRTIGWLSTGVPLILTVAKEQPFRAIVESIKTQYQSVPLYGIGAGVVENLSPYGQQMLALQEHQPIEVQFNYGGQSVSAAPNAPSWLRGKTDEQIVETRGLTVAASSSLLDWQGQILDGRLMVRWSYNQDWLRSSTIEGLAQGFGEALAAFARDGHTGGQE